MLRISCWLALVTTVLSAPPDIWLSPSTLKEFHQAFRSLDHSRDGKVSLHEISLGMQSVNEHIVSASNFDAIITLIPEKFSCVPSVHSPIDLVDCLVVTLRTLLSHIKVSDQDAYWTLISSADITQGGSPLHSHFISFEAAFNAYLGECDDVHPAQARVDQTGKFLKNYDYKKFDNFLSEHAFCAELVEQHPLLCLDSSDSGFCRLSCNLCPEASSSALYGLFSELVDGTGRKVFAKFVANNADVRVRGLDASFVPRVDKFDESGQFRKHLIGVMNNLQDGNDSCAPVSNATTAGAQLLFISDWHAEPWYLLNGTDEVSRFPSANLSNMFECRQEVFDSKTGGYVYDMSNCELDGSSDPPIEMIESALDFLGRHQRVSNSLKQNQSILAFVGDTQAHDWTTGVNAPEVDTVPILLKKCVQYMKTYVNPDYLFYTAGNNDGDHNSIFTSAGNPNVSLAWANVLINEGVVTNALSRKYSLNSSSIVYDTIELFQNTGYYIKKIPDNIVKQTFNSSNKNVAYYMITLNTNLGLTNYVQNTVFTTDLAWILSQNNAENGQEAYAIVLGHHPDITSVIVPSQYQSIVKGSLSGHVHYFSPTDANGFTILPAVTQYSLYQAVVMGNLTSQGNVNFTYENVQYYKGAVGTVPDEKCWA